MPFDMDNVPTRIKDLPKAAQRIWIAAYNSASEDGNDEESCNKIAWSAVKREYEQDSDGKWHKKDASAARIVRGEIIALADPKPGTIKTIQVIRAGEFEDMYGTSVSISTDDLDALIANSNAALGRQEIPVEIGHPTDPGAPAAAWYRRFFKKVIDGVEWVCAEVELTSQGVQVLADRLYKYFSAELNLDMQTITGGGFVNRPAVSGQQVVGSLAHLRPKGVNMPIQTNLFKRAGELLKYALGRARLEMSQEDRTRKINDALQAKYPADDALDGYQLPPYAVATFDDHVVVERGGKYFDIPYSIENDEVKLGDPVEVEITYMPKETEETNLSKSTRQGGDTNMDQKELEAKLAAAREEARLTAEKQAQEFQAQLVKAREEERAKVLAEAQRATEIAQFAKTATTGNKKSLPFREDELVALLGSLPDDVRKVVQDAFQVIIEKGLVDLSEIGSSQEGAQRKQLDPAVKIALARYVKGGGTVANFCKANGLQPEEYDFSEFEQK